MKENARSLRSAFAAILAAATVSGCEDQDSLTQDQLNQQCADKAIILQQGDYSWDVYVGGDRATWDLAYHSYESLPVKNQDFGQLIRVGNDCFRVHRVNPYSIPLGQEEVGALIVSEKVATARDRLE
jgi:hypothetical protein